MDIVYILGTGSPWQNNELRYSLRSVEKYLSAYDRIFVVGERPDWLTGVIHIPCYDYTTGDSRYKERNICKKVLKACEDERISENFLFCNDDYFFLRPVEVFKIANYHRGPLADAVSGERIDNYKNSLQNTLTILQANGLPAYHYDIHVPIIYNKSLFPKVMANYNWNVAWGYTVKSLYANTLRLSGAYMSDLKLNKPRTLLEINKVVGSRFVFSIGDNGLNADMKTFLQQQYPTPSKYESIR